MSRPTRKQALAWIRVHTSNGDHAAATRVYIENRISWAAFQAAVASAQK